MASDRDREYTQLSEVLTRAIESLSPYVELTDRHALVANLLEGGNDVLSFSQERQKTTEQVVLLLASKLYELVDGGVTIDELVEDLKNILSTTGENSTQNKESVAKKIKQFLRITYPGSGNLHKFENYESLARATDSSGNSLDDYCYLNDLKNYEVDAAGSSTGMSLNSGGIDTSDTYAKLYVAEMLSPRLGLPGRDTPGVSIFSSLIPPVEMSRCTPYVNIRVHTTSSAQTPPYYEGLSLMSFLNGKYETSPGQGLDDFLSFNADNTSIDPGMELFTSPQLLVPTRDSAVFSDTNRGNSLYASNPNAQFGGVTNTQAVMDRFRPFLSLKNISFSVVPTGGWMSYKSAKMELVLHDKSRLNEISSLVRPGLYNTTYFDIEYGWSHPVEKNLERNNIGAFLNSMRVKEQYNVVNPSFNFDDSGQVNITLQLAMKGNTDIASMDISECGASSTAKEIHRLLEEISKMISQLSAADSKKVGSIFGEVIMNAVGSASATLSLDIEKLKEVRKKIQSIRKSGVKIDGDLVNKLDELFDENTIEKYQNSASTAVNKQLSNLKTGIEIFPFHDQQIGKTSDFNVVLFNSFDGIPRQTVNAPISLGKVLTAFVGLPLARSENYKEIHFLFHTFNDKCNFMRDLCISKFPIPYDKLEKSIMELMKKNTKVSLSMFVNMINEKFVGNMGAHAYGLNFLYETDDEDNPKKNSAAEESKKKDEKENTAAKYAKQDKVINRAGIYDGTFTLPKIAIYPECVSHKKTGESILRLHVVDETASTFGTLTELLRAASEVNITAFGFSNNPNHPTLNKAPEINEKDIIENRRKTLDDLISAGVVSKVVQDTNTTATERKEPDETLNIDVSKLLKNNSLSLTKKYVARGIPIIRYGKDAGAIKSIGLQSMTDSSMTTINIIRMDDADASTPDLTLQRGVPIQIMPTECSIEMLGCPMLAYMQQFFVDFGTGTTADNVYNVTGIEHKIDPGSFHTSIKLTFTDAYGKYTSQMQKVKVASAWMRSYLGIPPEPKKQSSGGKGKSKPSNQFLKNISRSPVEYNDLKNGFVNYVNNTENNQKFMLIHLKDLKISEFKIITISYPQPSIMKKLYSLDESDKNIVIMFPLDPSLVGKTTTASVWSTSTVAGRRMSEDETKNLSNLGKYLGPGSILLDTSDLFGAITELKSKK
jgi:hypothetical protein